MVDATPANDNPTGPPRPPSVFDVLVDETPREVDSVLDPSGVLSMLRVGVLSRWSGLILISPFFESHSTWRADARVAV